ncbi:HAD-IC family P-type ATPase [Porcincola intestinalis]|uniref:HAD-IC family P-type ATPase n=1 Tax=Porcincola intestinalis TaxID=2606632 RepID=UPI002A83F31E|nr:HAD-IC family P-type ATPase [Porcincola intestinalis]MDY4205476.1 HAD-IC family P-type ATPase [Porcincola intestinalis]MDY5579169.1 HAD-IC family P-type ATPase [Porcincola intestinalis]
MAENQKTGRGLTSAEAEQLLLSGQGNELPQEGTGSVKSIVISNVFTYFNGIFLLLAILLIIARSYKSLTFLPIIIANTALGIAQQLYAKKVLDKLALLDVSEYTVIRDGKNVKVPSGKLVLGDVIRLESGQQIPADAVVVSGYAGVNESLLTGEADEIQKSEGSELKSGSFVASGRLLAKLTHVGKDSYAAQLTEKAREAKEAPSEMIHDVEMIILIAGILVIPVGGLLLYQGMAVNGHPFHVAVPSMVSAVTGMIPEGLYLLVTVALAMSAARLALGKVMLHDMHSIETLARVDVLCVDKTGTITSNVMKVTEFFDPADPSEALDSSASSNPSVPSASSEPEAGTKGDSAKGEPAAVAERKDARELLASYVSTVPDANITIEAIRAAVPRRGTLEGSEVQPFDSSVKYSEVRLPDGTLYRLGAPEYLLSEKALARNQTLIDQRAMEGKRVLALSEGSGQKAQPLLFIALENEIREHAQETFQRFTEEGVRVVVISGDNPLTVSKVAGKAGIPNADRYVDAASLDTDQKIRDAVDRYAVFGRVKPEQKKALVDAFRSKGLKVAMTGDGVNDIIAMKAADCSVAMGSGSDAARQAAQVVLLDSDFSHMHDIVLEGRRDINNITRSAMLFLYKNIFSLLLAVFSIIGTFMYPLRPTQVSLISTFNIGLPAFLLALEPNEKKQHGSFIRTTLFGAMPPALTSFFSIATMVLFAQLFNISQADVSTASTYLMALVGFLILLRTAQPLNRWRIAVIVGCVLGFLVASDYFSGLFEMKSLSLKAWALCLVFALAQVTVMRWLTQLFSWIEVHTETKRQ